VLGLRNQIRSDKLRASGFISQHDHFTGAGDAVDVDFAEDVSLGQSDEQVARSDDLVDSSNTGNSVRDGGNGLCSTHPVNFRDAKLVARCQQVSVVATEIGRRHHNDDLFDACHLSWHGCHQQC
jgi:hypothetical protein